jgi:hypothetical protein
MQSWFIYKGVVQESQPAVCGGIKPHRKVQLEEAISPVGS